MKETLDKVIETIEEVKETVEEVTETIEEVTETIEEVTETISVEVKKARGILSRLFVCFRDQDRV
jgi:methyl-accepting chemotaxis protein